MESQRRFSTEKYLKIFHNDSFRGPDKVKIPQKCVFWPTRWSFPKSVHTKSRGKPQKNCRASEKNFLSDNNIFTFHSFHAPYGYYCWYSYVFLGMVSCCQTRIRARNPTERAPSDSIAVTDVSTTVGSENRNSEIRILASMSYPL